MTYKKGDKVRYIGHRSDDGVRVRLFEKWHPPIGTVGTVSLGGSDVVFVRWPKGSTSGDDHWGITTHCIKPCTCDEGERGASCNPSFEELTGFTEDV